MNMLTEQIVKDPPVHVINAAEAVFIQIAFLKLLQDRLLPVKERLMKMIGAVDKRTGEPLTESSQIHRMDRRQWKEWREEYVYELYRLGFRHDRYQKGGACPVLEAESLLMRTRRALVLALSEYTDIKWDMLTCGGDPELLDTYLDLHLTWLSGHVDKKRRMAAANITGGICCGF